MTRTAATLLVGVAVSAVSGCVATEPGPAGAPAVRRQSPAPQHPPLPHLIGNGGHPEQLVEAPVHEVLEAAMPPSERAPEPERGPQPADARQSSPAPRPQQPRVDKPARRPAAPEPAAPSRRPAVHRKADPSPVLPKAPTSAADVCALGTGYGGWSPDSPQARICREAYGG